MRELWLADGRRLTWIEFGDPKGQPVVYMHLDYGLIRWPASAERHAAARKLRVIVPIRAGYGTTDLHLRAADHLGAVTQDYIAVLDHLAVLAKSALRTDFLYSSNGGAKRGGQANTLSAITSL